MTVQTEMKNESMHRMDLLDLFPSVFSEKQE